MRGTKLWYKKLQVTTFNQLFRNGVISQKVYPILSTSSSSSIFSMATKIGPLAVVGNEPRQARKGAAAVTDPGAGVWLVGVASLFHN